MFHDDFEHEYASLGETTQDDLLAALRVLRMLGPQAGRPWVDTLKGSRHQNMKELRVKSGGGAWRFAFVFDPKRQAIILCGGSKSGVSEKRFYRGLIERADRRYSAYIAGLKGNRNA